MIRKAFGGAFACALLVSVSGCNSTGSGASSVATQIATDIDTINAALTSPAAQQAVANAKALGMVIACDIAGQAAQAMTLNAAIKPLANAKQAALITRVSNAEAIVYTASSAICAQLGGSVAN